MISVTVVGGLLILVLTFHFSFYHATKSNYHCGAYVTYDTNRPKIEG